MPSPDYDVVIVGAGAAGLAALRELDRAGCRAACIEARDRIGGRILTVHDPLAPLPLELGAEFIHGRPVELWRVVRAENSAVYQAADAAVHIRNGAVQKHEEAWEPVVDVMADLQRAASQGPDQSFAAFLQRSDHSPEAKELSASFVEGFNAARKEVIGIASLAKDTEASEASDGDRSFRIFGGYDSIPLHLLRSADQTPSKLLLNTVVSGVTWTPGHVLLQTSPVLTGEVQPIACRKLVLTVPLGVLQTPPGTPGALAWNPVPEQALTAARSLEFGQVFRVVLRFAQAWWEELRDFADAGFFLSDEKVFPTWWTTLPVRAPILTGWSAGPHADQLLGKAPEEILTAALRSLSRMTGVREERIHEQLVQVYFHDWSADVFARGAYSYVPAGAMESREVLAQPVADTLYFAGEATETNGHSATVHGAIASGVRAARQVLKSLSLEC